MQTFYTEDPQQLSSMLEVRKLKHATLGTVQGRLVHGHVLCFRRAYLGLVYLIL